MWRVGPARFCAGRRPRRRRPISPRAMSLDAAGAPFSRAVKGELSPLPFVGVALHRHTTATDRRGHATLLSRKRGLLHMRARTLHPLASFVVVTPLETQAILDM